MWQRSWRAVSRHNNLDDGAGGIEDPEVIDYNVPDPDQTLGLIESQYLFETRDDLVEIHVRVVRPDVDEPVGVIAEFTPYQALAPRNPMLEPVVGEPSGSLSWEANPASTQVSDDSFQVVLETETLQETLYMSGTPKLNMTITASAQNVHITAVLQYQQPGDSDRSQVNYD